MTRRRLPLLVSTDLVQAVLLDSVTFLYSALTLRRLRVDEPPPA